MGFISFVGRVLFASLFLLSAYQEYERPLFLLRLSDPIKTVIAATMFLKGFGGLLFIFSSSFGAFLLLIYLAFITPIVYDFYNYEMESAQMAHPRFPLLELAYDDTHRAHMIADQNMAWPFADSMPPFVRTKRYTENDWRVTHQDYLHMWEQRVARTRLRPMAMEYNMEDVDTDAEDDYDVDTRWGNQPERAPVHGHMGQQLSRIVNDAGVAMLAMMRDFSDLSWRVRRTCQRMALKLNCVTAIPVDPERAPGGSSDSQPTGGGSSAMAGPSSSHRAGKALASPQASDKGVPGEDSEGSPAPGFADQFILSQHMDDAPPYTQTQGESSQMNMTQTQGETRMAMHYLGDAVGVTALTFPAVPIGYRPRHVGSVGQQMSTAHQIRGRHGVESRLPVEPCVLNLTVFKYDMF
nr:unnamed protein product [Digitaria exilis]